MRLRHLSILFAIPLFAMRLACAPVPVLQQYAGTWTVTRKSAAAAKEELKNQCASVGNFYVCQQSSNGAVSGLLVFTPVVVKPGAESNRFNTQNVLPDGRATGKGEVTINGNKWVFTSVWNGGATVTRYRTTNTFVTPNKIQFTQEETTDGTHWQLKDSGEEVRAAR